MLKSYGTIQPSGKGQKPGWFSLRLDDDFSKYYRWFSFQKWDLPMNGCHITFISGERESRIVDPKELEGLYMGIQFFFNPIVMTNGESFWIDCKSPELDRIRSFLGLGESFRGKYHITLGNLKKFRNIPKET